MHWPVWRFHRDFAAGLILLLVALPAIRLTAQSRIPSEQIIATVKDLSTTDVERMVMSADLKHLAFSTDVGTASVAAERAAFENDLARTLKGNASLGRGLNKELARTFVTDRRLVIVDGVQLGPYASLGIEMIFSADGRRFAFQAYEAESQFVVLDGRRLAGNYRAASFPIFSPDGSHFAYVGRDYDLAAKAFSRSRAVLDGVEQAACDSMADYQDDPGSSPITFSANGQSFAWVGIRQKQTWACVNGKEMGPFEQVTDAKVILSDDGRRAAFGFTRKTNQTARPSSFLMVDGKETPLKGRLAPRSLMFSTDGKRLAYVLLTGGNHRVAVDGKSLRDWSGETVPQVVFSPDSQRFAYVGRGNAKALVVTDGKAGTNFPSIAWGPSFSSNSRHLAFVAEVKNGTNRGSHYVAVVDGVEQESKLARRFEGPEIVFSADGEHFAYFGSKTKGQVCAVVDGRAGPEFPGTAEAHSLTISADGRRAAWVLNTSLQPAQKPGERALILDGRMQQLHRGLEPHSVRFSPDGRHCAYVATASKLNGEVVVVDGSPGKSYLSLLPPRSGPARTNLIAFDGNNRLRYFARTATELLRVEETLR